MAADDEIPPPATRTVPADRKVVLYTPDGKELVRPIGFAPVPMTNTSTKTGKLGRP